MANKQLQPHTKEDLSTSRVPKRASDGPAPANPGMHHVQIPAEANRGGLLAKGVSKTTAAQILSTDGGLGRVHGGAAITPTKSAAQPVPDHPHLKPTHSENKIDPAARLPDNRK
jgi:hypothetical protein